MKDVELDKNFLVQKYLATALWASNDENGEPLDRVHAIWDVDQSVVNSSAEDIEKFIALCTAEGIDVHDQNAMDGNTIEHVMHDLWLTRNGHGAGFWDGDYPTHGDKLTKLAKTLGEVNLYEGDDGTVYVL